MRVAVMENNRWNLMVLTSAIHKLLPQALVKGFTDGNAALAWCSEHSSEVDLFFGNWWSAEERPAAQREPISSRWWHGRSALRSSSVQEMRCSGAGRIRRVQTASSSAR